MILDISDFTVNYYNFSLPSVTSCCFSGMDDEKANFTILMS